MSKPTSEVLKRARALIAPGGAWTRGKMHRRAEGSYCASYCAVGAVKSVTQLGTTEKRKAMRALRRALPEGKKASVVAFNDETSKDRVLRLFDKAICEAEAEETTGDAEQ